MLPDLSQLSRFPGLVEWLRMWDVNDPATPAGASAVQVVDARLVLLEGFDQDEAECIVEATVREVNGRRYPVRVYPKFDDWKLGHECEWTSECGCGGIFECKHAYAVLAALRSVVAEIPATGVRLSRGVSEWLAALRTVRRIPKAPSASPAKQPKPNNRFLAYCIERDRWSTDPDYRLIPRVGNRGKTGFSIERGVAAADPFKPTKYMAAEDMPICTAFHARRRRLRTWGDGVPLEGDGWEGILFPALAAGRLMLGTFCHDPDDRLDPTAMVYQPLTEGPVLRVSAAWSPPNLGGIRPVLILAGPDGTVDGELIATEPPLYLDLENCRVGRVDTGELAPEFLHAWAKGPVVPLSEAAGVCARLTALAPDNPPPLPVEPEPEVLTGLTPEAVLRVTEVKVGVYLLRHIAAVAEFRYPGGKVLPPLGRGEPPQCVWFDGKRRVVLERDAATEARLMGALTASGLVPAVRHFAPHDLNGVARAAWFQEDPRAPAADWIHFLAGAAASGLAAAGWRLESDPALGLTVHDVRDFFPAIEGDPDHGIDWFRFDVTGEFEGKRVSLIPQIAKAIADDLLERHHDPENRPEFLLLPCDNPADGHIRFPADRFLAMIEQVRHLFLGLPGGGPIRLDRLAAAGIADSLAIESSATTRALAALGRSLRDIRGLPDDPVPASLRGSLRPYQAEGYRWLRFLATHGLHGILADDMGLGKTLQTIAHLAAEAATRPEQPSLVIAPTSVVPNWQAEFAKFAPSLKVLVLHGNDRADYFQFIREADVVVTSYPLLTRDFGELAARRWHVLVLDEAQYIKNPKSITARNACGLKAAHRLCLSGTPLENHLGELWSLMRFLMPGFLADEKTFTTVFRKPIERDRSQDAQHALNRRVAPLILRRTKDQVATDLPEKTLIVHGIDLEPRQADLYESVRAAMDRRVRDALAAKGLAKSHIIVLDALLKLRQICCHPQLLATPAARSVMDSAKLDYLTEELLPTLIEEGRRILLFSQFTSMLQIIEEHLVTAEIPYLKLTGETRERAKLVADFQGGVYPVFLISLKAGGTGLNLTAADTVIHYDPWWNPAAENQASDRAHRIGQTKPVFVHKLVCRGTIEERILDLQRHKAALVKALLSEDTAQLRIDAETLSHLLAPLG